MKSPVHKKTVLVTGSSRGIGKAIAVCFAKEGYNVVINSNKSIDELNNVYNQIKGITPDVMKITCDVSNYGEVFEMHRKIEDRFGFVDVLVNNAAVSHFALFDTLEPSGWEPVIASNLYSVLNCSNIFVKPMIQNKRGTIINISSVWGETGASCETIYSLTKGAVNTFTKALAKELGPSGIRVNAISCGVINTKMNEWLSEEEKDELINNIAMSRFGEPEEIAQLCLFLSGKNAEYITGQIIKVDGGFL